MVLGSLCVAVLALEFVLAQLGVEDKPADWRARGLYRPDPELIFSLVPNASNVWQTGEFLETAHTNSLGLRDREVAARREGEKRILVLGDSMTFGHGVNDDESFPNQLEMLLARDGKPSDVINAGMKGFGTDQEFKLFEGRLRDLEPDVVLFCIYVNDMLDNIYHPLYTIRDGELVPLDPRRDYLYRLGVILDHVPAVLHDLRLVRFVSSRLAALSARRPKRELEIGNPARWAQRKFELELRALQSMAREDGFALVVVGLPQKDAKQMYGWVPKLDVDGLRFLDLSLSPEWCEGTDGLFFETDYHLTPEGNRRVALSLLRYLSEPLGDPLAAAR